MSSRPPARVAACAFVLALTSAAAFGCRGRSESPQDAAVEMPIVDAAPTPDAGPKPLALDFAVTGCATYDPSSSRCDGPAPLTLLFTPVASMELTRFFWTFGDSTSSSERSPSHTYSVPSAFTVTLTAGGESGTGSLQQSHVVNVTGAPVGGWCDVDSECADGFSCWCGAANPCSPVLSRGLCSRPCDLASGGPANCPDGSSCSDLSVPQPADAGAAPGGRIWQRPLCLATCSTDDDCRPGLACRALRATPETGGWVRVCFGFYPLAIGDRCVDPNGARVDTDCASLNCADLGLFGRCSAACASDDDCPDGSGCAHFGDGRDLCLARCVEPLSCTDDPLLSCEAPGKPGPLGFTLMADKATVPSIFCAPKLCVTSDDCGPLGTCPTGGGNCHR